MGHVASIHEPASISVRAQKRQPRAREPSRAILRVRSRPPQVVRSHRNRSPRFSGGGKHGPIAFADRAVLVWNEGTDRDAVNAAVTIFSCSVAFPQITGVVRTKVAMGW